MRISSIKSGKAVVEELPLRRNEQIFSFFYHWIDMYTELMRLIVLNMSQQNHSHLVIIFFKHYHIYYFEGISTIKSGI